MIPALYRHLLESTFFCGFLACIAFLFRNRGAAARHALWLIGMLKFAIPASLLAILGARVGILFPSAFAAKISELLAAIGLLPQTIVFEDLNWLSLIGLSIWAAVTVALLVRWILRLHDCGRGLTLPPAAERTALAQACQRLGMRSSIGLFSSNAATEPRLLGILNPAVTVPRGLSNRLNAAEFEAVLLHELAHARRCDNFTSSLAHLLVCVFWFHPLLWWMERQLTAERERACDEMVVRCGAAPRDYVAGILKVCRFHLADPVAGSSGITGSDLKRRVDLILSHQRHNPLPHAPYVLLAFLSVLITVLPLASGYCQQCSSSAQLFKEKPNHANSHPGPATR